MNAPDDWVKLPPGNPDESPEEIRRQRDLYRELLDSWLREKWNGVTPGDWSAPDGCNSEIQAIIAELESGSTRG